MIQICIESWKVTGDLKNNPGICSWIPGLFFSAYTNLPSALADSPILLWVIPAEGSYGVLEKQSGNRKDIPGLFFNASLRERFDKRSLVARHCKIIPESAVGFRDYFGVGTLPLRPLAVSRISIWVIPAEVSYGVLEK